MVYECKNCGLVLAPRALNCPRCGQGFDVPVPLDAEMPNRGFVAKTEAMPGQGSFLPATGTRDVAEKSQDLTSTPPPQGKRGEAQVLSFSGKGDKKSAPFTVGDRWRVEWDTKVEGHAHGNFSIDIHKVRKADPISRISGGRSDGSDSSEEYGAGQYYLKVGSLFMVWTVRVINYEL